MIDSSANETKHPGSTNIAFVHDWLISFAGSERVLAAAVEPYPDAPIYTLVHNADAVRGTVFEGRQIHTSFIQRLPGARTNHRRYLPLMPIAIEQFDLSRYELVISSTHAVAKGVLTGADQLHIGYVHTPMRYAWDLYYDYLRESGLGVGQGWGPRGIRSKLARLTLHYLRLYDRLAADRVDVLVANSRYVARRINKIYRRSAQVIYPPVDVDRFDPSQHRDDFYLVISRLVPYKKVRLIVEAFADIGRRLVVVGDGPADEVDRVRSAAGPDTRFVGTASDAEVADYMQRCRAFVFAADEDFGITPVEAMAAGAPVIAYGKGGVLETVVDGQTGVFFETQTADAIVEAVHRFESHPGQWSGQQIRQQAEKFTKQRFWQEFDTLVAQARDTFIRDRR